MGIEQELIDQAVRIATKRALDGHPVERIMWIPPSRATEVYTGSFVVKEYNNKSAMNTPPWEL